MTISATAYVTYGLQVRLIKAGRVIVRTAIVLSEESLWSNYYLVEKTINKGLIASFTSVPSVLRQVREVFCVHRTWSKVLFFCRLSSRDPKHNYLIFKLLEYFFIEEEDFSEIIYSLSSYFSFQFFFGKKYVTTCIFCATNSHCILSAYSLHKLCILCIFLA